MSCVHFCGLKRRNDVYEMMTQSHKHRYCYVLVDGAPEANSSRPVCLCVCACVCVCVCVCVCMCVSQSVSLYVFHACFTATAKR